MANKGISSKAQELQKEIGVMEKRSKVLMKKAEERRLPDSENEELTHLLEGIRDKAAEAMEEILKNTREK